MPKPDAWVKEMMRLYQRCKERNALPVAGGVFDQPLEIMEAFDIIDDVLAKRKKAEQQGISREEEILKARGALNGRRR